MTATILPLISLFLAGIAVGGSFVPRFPSVPVAFIALLLSYFAPSTGITGSMLAFWAVASALATGINFLHPKALTGTSHGHAYVAGGTLTGTIAGLAITSATATLGACLGAFLGALAYMRTPASPRFTVASSQFVQYLAAKGLPDVLTCVMAALVIAAFC
ncbi:MAG: DUF456 family protein [Muribaculaceae bacterium]|nr:DUF456 family protein [Muribaculaceae bacterium]